MPNDSIGGRGHRDGPGLGISLLHHRTPTLQVPQTGNWEGGLGPVGLGRLLSCSHKRPDELVIWTAWSQLSNRVKYNKVGAVEKKISLGGE